MNIEIITIGDELLIGQVVDTNSAWMGQVLNKVGIEVMRITSVRDRAKEITNAFDEAFARVNTVLVTGGLGPTKDDITKQVLCNYFGGELAFNEEMHTALVALLERRGIAINPSTYSQCIVPTSCEPIENRVGTAPIMWFEQEGKVLVSMPGVPFEMQQTMSQDILPRLVAREGKHTVIEHRTWMVGSYTESRLSEFLTDFEAALPQALKLAYLPTPGMIRLRLTARCNEMGEATALLQQQGDELERLLGNTILCNEDTSLAGALGMMLAKRGYSLATAESCTGGNIAHEITTTPNASTWYKGSVVSYANSAKEELLLVAATNIATHGAVSSAVVEQMARGAQQQLHTECAIATSGIAGPTGGTPGKPVGTVWVAIACKGEVRSRCYHFGGARHRIIERATAAALLWMMEWLNEGY